MSNADNINVFEQIQTLCSDFRRQLKQGESARIEDYLDDVGDASREMLFQNLLHADMEFLRRQRKNPLSNEYIARFPQFGRLIRQAFYESTMMSRDVFDDTPGDEPTMQFLGQPAASRLGEYELRRELGSGGFGVVYEARHLQRNDLVALKTLPNRVDGQGQLNRDAERLHKFRREFRALSDVNHPNLVGMQSLEVDGDQWFLTMDLIDGVDFTSYVCPHVKLDEDRLRAVLPQLVSGIMALHSQHIIHRDVKPSNVMVTNDGQVVVLDFGLVAETNHSPIGFTANLSKNFAGTPHYAAPEQMSGSRTAASDWYALGVMLYEALAGELPYQGTAIEVLTKKTMEDPPTLMGRAGIAADLAELAMGLLARTPDDRPDSLEIARIISANLPTGSSSKSSEQILVGRDSHLKSMQQAYDTFVSSRDATTLFVDGKSGEGKTTLVEYFLDRLRDSSEVVVLSGRCYDRESLPFKALDSLSIRCATG